MDQDVVKSLQRSDAECAQRKGSHFGVKQCQAVGSWDRLVKEEPVVISLVSWSGSYAEMDPKSICLAAARPLNKYCQVNKCLLTATKVMAWLCSCLNTWGVQTVSQQPLASRLCADAVFQDGGQRPQPENRGEVPSTLETRENFQGDRRRPDTDRRRRIGRIQGLRPCT